MKYYLSSKCAYREYGDLSILFLKTNNPNNEFIELNCTGKEVINFMMKYNRVSKKAIIDYVCQNSYAWSNNVEKEICDFIDALVNKDIICMGK